MMTAVKQAVSAPPPSAALLISGALVAGSSAMYAQNLMAGLTRKGMYHPLLTPTPPGLSLLSREELKSVQVAKGLEWLQWRPFVFSKIVAWAREQEPELLHSLAEHGAAICAKLSDVLKLPYVLTVHDYVKGPLPMTRRCRGVIAPNEPMREHLVNDADVPKERVRVIPPGLDIPASKKPANDPALPMAQLVVSIGDFNRSSDYATFMEAVRVIVDKQGESCSIVISGEGPQESALRKFCRELKLDRRVTFSHGHTEHDRLL